jgi:hypothetical protein
VKNLVVPGMKLMKRMGHGLRGQGKNDVALDVRMEASFETGTDKWDKEPSPETTTTTYDGIQKDSQEDPTAGDLETRSRDV